MGTLSCPFLTLSLQRVGRELSASADRLRITGIDNYFVRRLSSLVVVPKAILHAPTSFYTWVCSGCIRLLACVADWTSHGVNDNDSLHWISSAKAAMFTIRRVLADFYALMCSGWPTLMPLPEWHVPIWSCPFMQAQLNSCSSSSCSSRGSNSSSSSGGSRSSRNCRSRGGSSSSSNSSSKKVVAATAAVAVAATAAAASQSSTAASLCLPFCWGSLRQPLLCMMPPHKNGGGRPAVTWGWEGLCCGTRLHSGGVVEHDMRELVCRKVCRKVCGLVHAEQRQVPISHGVKRHPLRIRGVDRQSLHVARNVRRTCALSTQKSLFL